MWAYYNRVLRLELRPGTGGPIQDTLALDWGKAMHEVQALRAQGVGIDEALGTVVAGLKDDPKGLRTPQALERYARAYEDLKQPFTPVQSEFGWSMPLNASVGGFELWIRGVQDLIAKDEGGRIWDVELHTSSRPPGMFFSTAATKWQWRIYAAASSAIVGKEVDQLWLVYMYLVKTAGEKKPWVEVILQNPTWVPPLTTFMPRLVRRCQGIAEQICWAQDHKDQVHLQFPEFSDQGCGAYWSVCPYFPICQGGAGYWPHQAEWEEMYQVAQPSSREITFKEIPNPKEVIGDV